MRACVVDYQHVAHIDMRQLAVDGELVVVLAQIAGDVIRVCDRGSGLVGATRLTHDGDVVVGAIHGGADQVDRAGIDADIVLIDLLLVNGLGDQAAIGAHHKAAHLGADGNVAHACGNQNLVVGRMHSFADGVDVVCLLLGQIGDTHAA